jgi:hypothetical protein
MASAAPIAMKEVLLVSNDNNDDDKGPSVEGTESVCVCACERERERETSN